MPVTKSKEVAKFFSGIAANQVLTHGAFAASGVQFQMFGVNYDRGLNSIAAVVWAVALVLLFYYAWMRK